jgi:hypothetical protein
MDGYGCSAAELKVLLEVIWQDVLGLVDFVYFW